MAFSVKVIHKISSDRFIPFQTFTNENGSMGLKTILGDIIYPCCFDTISFIVYREEIECSGSVIHDKRYDLIEFQKDGRKALMKISNLLEKVPERDRELLKYREIMAYDIKEKFVFPIVRVPKHEINNYFSFRNGDIVTIPINCRCLKTKKVAEEARGLEFFIAYVERYLSGRDYSCVRAIPIQIFGFVGGAVREEFQKILQETHDVNAALDSISGKPFIVQEKKVFNKFIEKEIVAFCLDYI